MSLLSHGQPTRAIHEVCMLYACVNTSAKNHLGEVLVAIETDVGFFRTCH